MIRDAFHLLLAILFDSPYATCILTSSLLFNRLSFGSWLFLLIFGISRNVVVSLLFTLLLLLLYILSILYYVYDCDHGGALDIRRKEKHMQQDDY